MDFLTSGRWGRALVQGGVSTGKKTLDVCAIVTKYPNVQVYSFSQGSDAAVGGPSVSADFCHREYPFLTQLKMLGSYRLPWDAQVAVTYQNLPGPEILANAVFTTDQVARSLGRPLGAASTVNINIVKPGTLYGERLQQFDLRFTKTFKLKPRGARVQTMVDLYNALNGNAVTLVTNTYGATTGALAGAPWLQPQGILPPRLLKFGVQLDF